MCNYYIWKVDKVNKNQLNFKRLFNFEERKLSNNELKKVDGEFELLRSII